MLALPFLTAALLLPLAGSAAQVLIDRSGAGSSATVQKCTFAKGIPPAPALPIDPTCNLGFLDSVSNAPVGGGLLKTPDGDNMAGYQVDLFTRMGIFATDTVQEFSVVTPNGVYVLCYAGTSGTTSAQIDALTSVLSKLLPSLGTDAITQQLNKVLLNTPVVGLQCNLEFEVLVSQTPGLAGQRHNCTYDVPFPYVSVATNFQACSLPKEWQGVFVISVKFAGSKFPIETSNTALSPGYGIDDFLFTKQSPVCQKA